MPSDVEHNPSLYWQFFRRYALLGIVCFVLSAAVMIGLRNLAGLSDSIAIYLIGVAILFLPFPLMGMYGLNKGYSIYWGGARVCFGKKAKFWNGAFLVMYIVALFLSVVLFVQESPNV